LSEDVDAPDARFGTGAKTCRRDCNRRRTAVQQALRRRLRGDRSRSGPIVRSEQDDVDVLTLRQLQQTLAGGGVQDDVARSVRVAEQLRAMAEELIGVAPLLGLAVRVGF